jgi:hypothetical protein
MGIRGCSVLLEHIAPEHGAGFGGTAGAAFSGKARIAPVLVKNSRCAADLSNPERTACHAQFARVSPAGTKRMPARSANIASRRGNASPSLVQVRIEARTPEAAGFAGK